MATQQITVTVAYEPMDSRLAEVADGDGQRYRLVGITASSRASARSPTRRRHGATLPRRGTRRSSWPRWTLTAKLG